jgi:GxxExxY protein
MSTNEITYTIIGCAYKVHRTLGPGLNENVYEKALQSELRSSGLQVQSQVTCDVTYNEQLIAHAYRIDLLVENEIIVELKSTNGSNPIHFQQLLTYLRLMNKRVGLLINFNVTNLQKGIHRIVNKYYGPENPK